ncbi:MAG: hypothetical protein ACREH4_13420 [Vitreimonas sp.]
MVTSIGPGAVGAGPLGVDARYGRPGEAPRRDGAPDRVELSAASIRSAGDSVRDALMQIHSTLALGHDAQAMLVKLQAFAREGAGAQSRLDELLAPYAQRVQVVLADGARVAAGETIFVQAEPNAAPVAIAGVDLRLGGAISVSASDDAMLAQAAQRALETLQEAMGRLLDRARALEAHQGFLDAAAAGAGVRHDLDTDGARLLALQVRQALEDAGAPIANVEPQAVLSLFR